MENLSKFLACALLFLMISCGGLKNSNFDRQKYTGLKSTSFESTKNTDTDVTVVEPEAEVVVDSNPSSLWTLTDEPIESEFETSNVSELVEQEDVNKNVEIATNEEPNRARHNSKKTAGKIIIGNRRDFEKLSEEEQNQAIIDFNWLFNTELTLLLMAALFLIMGAFYIWFFLPGALLLVTSFIMSFISLKKLKRIDESKHSKKLVNRLNLTRLLCGIGIAVCVVSLTAWIIVLILWLTRVI